MQQNEAEDLTLHYARYGSLVHKRDVLEIIDDQVSPHDRLNLLVNSDNLGGDYYPGKAKQLHIIYTFNGVLYEETLDEGEMLVIPRLQVTDVKEIRKMEWSDILVLLLVWFSGGAIGYALASYEERKRTK